LIKELNKFLISEGNTLYTHLRGLPVEEVKSEQKLLQQDELSTTYIYEENKTRKIVK